MGRRHIAWKDELEAISLGMSVPLTGGMTAPFVMARYVKELFRDNDNVKVGTVITYNPQAHSAAVFVGRGTWSCIFSDEHISYSFGFSMTHPPREGDLVLVYSDNPTSRSGYVIGRIPYEWNFSKRPDRYKDPDKYHRRSYTQLKGTIDTELQFYTAPFSNPSDDSTHLKANFRPTDIYPGEFANLNQHNCGIKGGLFSATLLGGGASLRMSALTNAARLSCESYIRHSLSASYSEYHNGRYLSSERNTALYQEERLGGSKPLDKVWTEDSEAPVEGENQTMRPRMKELSGYFGNISAKFCLRPDPDDTGIRIQDETARDEEGVSRETVDPSGQYRLSSAGMITIERTGRIPVPVRTCYPTDKDHDIEEMPETLKPFEHKEGDPGYRQLELFDRQAYDLKNQYSRVDGLGTEHPDFYVPDEEDMGPLNDSYDEKFTGSSTVNLRKFDKRRAGVYIGEDGSVIVRDAWGSEIVMLGGNITFACAGNVMNLPGMTALTIAGDDIVQKAQNSIDIHASAHDIRLSAAKNMEILGGADEKDHQGGVIIESRGTSFVKWDGKGKGESAELNGITIRTKGQGVVIDGRNVVMRSRENTNIVSGDSKVTGVVSMAADMIRTRASQSMLTSDSAALGIDGKGIDVIGKNVGIYSIDKLNMMRGSQIPVPMKWEKSEDGPFAEESLPGYLDSTNDLKDEEKASLGFDHKSLDKMIFGFRTSDECGTTMPWTIGADRFRLFEPAWVQVMNIYETLKGANVDSKPYDENGDWGKNGMPFPGEEAKAEYAQLSRLEGKKPYNLTDDGLNRSRKLVAGKSEIENVELKGNYQIRNYLKQKRKRT